MNLSEEELQKALQKHAEEENVKNNSTDNKKKKSKNEDEIVNSEEDTNDLIAKLVKEKEAKLEKEIAMEESELSLEDEIKLIVSKNTDDATELIKTWLSE